MATKYLIPPKRLDTFVKNLLAEMEKKDQNMAKKLKDIKGRTKGHRLEFTKDARIGLNIVAMLAIKDSITKSIEVVYIKGDIATISKDIMEQGKDL